MSRRGGLNVAYVPGKFDIIALGWILNPRNQKGDCCEDIRTRAFAQEEELRRQRVETLCVLFEEKWRVLFDVKKVIERKGDCHTLGFQSRRVNNIFYIIMQNYTYLTFFRKIQRHT